MLPMKFTTCEESDATSQVLAENTMHYHSSLGLLYQTVQICIQCSIQPTLQCRRECIRWKYMISNIYLSTL